MSEHLAAEQARARDAHDRLAKAIEAHAAELERGRAEAQARIISALLTLRDHVIGPILAGVRSPRMGRKPTIWTSIDRDCEALCIGMYTLFRHVGIETQAAAA
jgi:hypothetical protein